MSFGGVASDAPETMNGTALFAIVLPPLTISRNALPEMPGGTTNADTPSASLTTPTGLPPKSSCAPAGTPVLHDDAPAHGSHFRLELEAPFGAEDGGGEEDRGGTERRTRLTLRLYAPAPDAANALMRG